MSKSKQSEKPRSGFVDRLVRPARYNDNVGLALNVLAGIAASNQWRMAKVTPVGNDGIDAHLVVDGPGGGGWIYPIRIRGNIVELDGPNKKSSDCANKNG